jgi:ribosomal protein L40E
MYIHGYSQEGTGVPLDLCSESWFWQPVACPEKFRFICLRFTTGCLVVQVEHFQCFAFVLRASCDSGDGIGICRKCNADNGVRTIPFLEDNPSDSSIRPRVGMRSGMRGFSRILCSKGSRPMTKRLPERAQPCRTPHWNAIGIERPSFKRMQSSPNPKARSTPIR